MGQDIGSTCLLSIFGFFCAAQIALSSLRGEEKLLKSTSLLSSSWTDKIYYVLNVCINISNKPVDILVKCNLNIVYLYLVNETIFPDLDPNIA